MADITLTPSESFAKWLATEAPSGRPQIGRRPRPYGTSPRDYAPSMDRLSLIASAVERARGYTTGGNPIPLDFNY